jgi:hypothetical protein
VSEQEGPRINDRRGQNKRSEQPSSLTEEQQQILNEQFEKTEQDDAEQRPVIQCTTAILVVIGRDGTVMPHMGSAMLQMLNDHDFLMDREATPGDLVTAGAHLESFGTANTTAALVMQNLQLQVQQRARAGGAPLSVDPRVAAAARGQV